MTQPLHPPAPLGRSGHLLDATLERLIFDELDQSERALVEAHVASCATCARRLEAALADERALASALPSSLVVPSSPEPLTQAANTPSRWRTWLAAGAGAVASAAAILLWVAMPGVAPDPGYRLKGSAVSLEAFAKDGEHTWQLVDGDEVEPSWRVGFRVVSSEVGYLWIVGIDADLATYPVAPVDGGQPLWFDEDTAASPSLTAAVRFDAKPGIERVVALLCDAPIRYETVVEELVHAANATAEQDHLPHLVSVCFQSEVRLHKSGEP